MRREPVCLQEGTLLVTPEVGRHWMEGYMPPHTREAIGRARTRSCRLAWSLATAFLLGLVPLLGVAPSAGQTLLDEYRPTMERMARTGPPEARASLPGVQPSFARTSAEDWARLVDQYWGQGVSTSEKLRIFDEVVREIDREYGAFVNHDVNINALRDRWRPEIAAGVSRGRFAAILNHFSLELKDIHTLVVDRTVTWGTPPRPGVPLLVLGAWLDNSRFGACLTPLPDGSLLVYRALPNHVLDLQPGDLVLGYDGVPWLQLAQELLAAELPIHLQWVCGSTVASMEHCVQMSAGLNWHLFDTIDIVKYGTNETLQLPTAPLANQWGLIWGNEQLPVPGVPMQDYPREEFVTWGIVEGTRIGYIYVSSWHWDDRYRIREKFYNAIYDLMMQHDTIGMIVDFRLNTGGYMLMAHSGYTLLFNERLAKVAFDVRGDPNDHLDMVPHPEFTAQLFTIPGNPATYYDKPIAVLTGPGAVSNGDWESLRMQFHPRVRVFGKPTNGGFTSSDTPNLGSAWYFTKATGSGYLVDGHTYLAHTGAPVHEEVWLTRDDVAQGRDTVVEAAIQWITKNQPPRLRTRLRAQAP